MKRGMCASQTNGGRKGGGRQSRRRRRRALFSLATRPHASRSDRPLCRGGRLRAVPANPGGTFWHAKAASLPPAFREKPAPCRPSLPHENWRRTVQHRAGAQPACPAPFLIRPTPGGLGRGPTRIEMLRVRAHPGDAAALHAASDRVARWPPKPGPAIPKRRARGGQPEAPNPSSTKQTA